MPQTNFEKIPLTFKDEINLLFSHGITCWELLLKVSDSEIHQIVQGKLASIRNLKRLQCMAIFICELNLEMGEAALLMQSGLASVQSLAKLTPQELVQRTGRLERSLSTGREPIVNLKKAFLWIKIAKQAIANKSTKI